MVTDTFPGFLSPYLPKGEGGERLLDELTDFLARRHGIQVEEIAGRRMACLPVGAFTEALAWEFVADHLITQVSLPVRKLEEMARMFSRGVRALVAADTIDRQVGRRILSTLQEATRELRRLDGLSRGLRALPEEGRPGRDLYDSDPEAYARAMWQWESERPSAVEELEGGFFVTAVEEGRLDLHHLAKGEAICLSIPQVLARSFRQGDRIDALLGRGRFGWFVMDSFAVAAPRPTAEAADLHP